MPAHHELPARDLQLRFLLPAAGVRGVAVSLQDTWQAIAGRAEYPASIAELLGEAAAAAALFTGHAMVDGRLSVQLRSQGALRTLFAECTAAGTLRGIAQFDEQAAPPSRDLRQLGDDAVLAITIENPSLGGRDPMRYQGLVALEADNLGDAFEGYFRQSEQLPTRLLLASDGTRAAGLMLQKLPGDGGDEDGWGRAGALFDTLGQAELLALPPEEVIHRLFHEEAPEVVGQKPLRFACSCSRDRVAAMLVSLGAEEAHAAVDAGDGEARIRCEFCGEEYRFDGEEVSELFRASAAQVPAAPGIQ
jgi:molecular chaperone Hsp33